MKLRIPIKCFFIIVLLCLIGEFALVDDMEKCPQVVTHLCDHLSDRFDVSVVTKCKEWMGILWKRGTDESKYMLFTAAKVEKFYEND